MEWRNHYKTHSLWKGSCRRPLRLVHSFSNEGLNNLIRCILFSLGSRFLTLWVVRSLSSPWCSLIKACFCSLLLRLDLKTTHIPRVCILDTRYPRKKQSVSICKQTNEPNNKQRAKNKGQNLFLLLVCFCIPQRARSALSDVNYEEQKRHTYARLPVHRRMVHFSISQRRIDKVRYGTMCTAYCGELEVKEWCE